LGDVAGRLSDGGQGVLLDVVLLRSIGRFDPRQSIRKSGGSLFLGTGGNILVGESFGVGERRLVLLGEV